MENSCTVNVKVIPNAPRNEVVGWLGDALKVKIHAPPVDGRANEALCEFLSVALGLPARAVSVLRGGSSRQKVISIVGLTRSQLDTKLGLTSQPPRQKSG